MASTKKFKTIEDAHSISEKLGVDIEVLLTKVAKMKKFQFIFSLTIFSIVLIITSTVLGIDMYNFHMKPTEVRDTVSVLILVGSLIGVIYSGWQLISWIFCADIKGYSYIQDFFGDE